MFKVIKDLVIVLFLLLISSAVFGAGVVDGQPVNSTVTNAAYLYKNGNDATSYNIALNNTSNSAYGTTIASVQREYNSIWSYLGGLPNQLKTYLPTWASNLFGILTDTVKARVDKIDAGALNKSLADSNIFVGSGAGVATSVPLSGDASINSAGYFTLNNDAIISKLLSGFTPITSATVNSSDSILTGIEKLEGSKMPLSYLDIDTAMTANSNVKVPSQHAVIEYVSTHSNPNAVPDSRTINNHSLVTNITLNSNDIGLAAVTNDAQIPLSYLDVDTELTANSNVKVPSQAAVKNYVDNNAGGGGDPTAKNYITNYGAEKDLTGWATYADAAGVDPVNGTGGSPTSTLTRSTSVPLAGVASFVFDKDAADRQGEGFSYDFTIDAGYQSQMMTLSILYTTSANYVDGDIGLYLYDVTNGVLLKPSDERLFGGTAKIVTFQFQTPSNSTSLRLIGHIKTTNPLNYTLKFDNVSFAVSKPIVQGGITTNLAAYTYTGTWANATYDGLLAQAGEYYHIVLKVVLTGAASGALDITVPNGRSIDLTKVPIDMAHNGSGFSGAVGLMNHLIDNYQGIAIPQTSNLIRLGYVSPSSAVLTTSSLISTNVPWTWAAGDVVSIDIMVPIVGFSTNMDLSENASNRRIALYAAGNAGESITANVTDIPFIATEDTMGAWDGSGFTAPETSDYDFKGMIGETGSTATNLQMYISGTGDKYINTEGATPTETVHSFNGKIKLLRNQRLSIRSTTGMTLSNTAIIHWIAITKIANPQTIATNQPVQYTGTATDTNYTDIKTTLIPYVTVNGVWRMKIETVGTYTGSPSSGALLLSYNGTAIITKNLANYYQPMYCGSTGQYGFAYFQVNDNRLEWTLNAGTARLMCHGDIELEGKPTWVN